MPSPSQTKYGNEVVAEVREAIKDMGWEKTAFAAMMAHMAASAAFVKLVPNLGRPGSTIVTDEVFQELYQEMVSSLALLTAVAAEKCGADLVEEVPATN